MGKREIIKNVGSSWFALGMNVLVGIFLSPYILHRLGDTAFGLWILIFSVTGYYGLFDLGIRSSIVRYIARYSTSGEQQELRSLVNTALLAYTLIGAAAMMVTIAAMRYVDRLFQVPPDFLVSARWLLLIVGTSVSLGFPLAVFSGILEGLQRFYVLNSITVSTSLLRALLVVIALQHGGGLLTVALITVVFPLIAGVGNFLSTLRLLPLRFGLRYVKKSSLRQIASYSGTTFLIIVAGKLRFKTDALIVGTFVSAVAITYFTIGSRLVDYATETVSSLAQIFIPMSSQSQARGDIQGLRRILLLGNRASAFIIFPITVILTILGKSVIEAWVGSKYVAASYPVMLVLLYPTTLMLAQSSSGRTLWGLAKHRTWAWVALAEGAANLILSVILVRRYGIMGDAIGTAIPLVFSMILFLPRHLCKLLGIDMKSYLSQAYLLPALLCVPLTAVLLLMQRWYVPHSLLQLLVQVVIAAIVYGVGLAWAFWDGRAWEVGALLSNPDDEVSLALVETYQEEA
jgi:O-antigen/teichoic acid export membrane protein